MTPELHMLFFMPLLKSPHLTQIDSKIHLHPPPPESKCYYM